MLDTVNTTGLNTDNTTNTTAVTSYYGTAGDNAGNIKYDPFAPNQVAAQHALDDVQTIKPRTRDEYVGLFKRTEERTARATLQMCRVVYEAKQTLKEHEFADFCSTVGYKDTSATVRKYCAIGKLQPRLVQHAAFMPHEWSKIYVLTQIPAKLFEQFVEQQRDFRALTAKELKTLVDSTKPEQKSLEALMPKDKDSNNFVFARLMFDKTFVDAYDWRAVRKALAEIESRLPIKVQLTAAADAAYKQTVVHRYNDAKDNAKDVEFKPALWDYGIEAAQDNLRVSVAEANTVEAIAEPMLG
tara:strand:+ start:182 stop:1078 length:897 start_codon:yes stop_codon:yes gene_type:complete